MKSLYFVRHHEPGEDELQGVELAEGIPRADYFPGEDLVGAARLGVDQEYIELYQALIRVGDLLGDGSQIDLLFDKIASQAYQLGRRDAEKLGTA